MIRKVLHISLAAVLLISTLGVTINMHFCHDQLIDLALYAPAESCCDPGEKMSCHSEEGMEQTNHCEDDFIVVEALDDFIGSTFTYEFENNQLIDIHFWIVLKDRISSISDSSKPKIPAHYWPPPYQEVDLSHIQSYLI